MLRGIVMKRRRSDTPKRCWTSESPGAISEAGHRCDAGSDNAGNASWRTCPRPWAVPDQSPRDGNRRCRGFWSLKLNDFQILLEQRIGEKPEIASTAGRPVAAEQSHGRNRDFHEAAVGERVKGETGLLRNPIQVVLYRVGAGAIAVSRLLKRAQRPEVAARDGKGCARDIPDTAVPPMSSSISLALRTSVRELGAGLMIGPYVSHAVGGKFMAVRNNALAPCRDTAWRSSPM